MSTSVPPEWRERMRTGLTCHYCFAVATTWDHIVPRCRDGEGYPWNIQPACEECNVAKGTRLPICRCRRCQRALSRWRRRLPEDRRRQLIDTLTAQIEILATQLDELAAAPAGSR